MKKIMLIGLMVSIMLLAACSQAEEVVLPYKSSNYVPPADRECDLSVAKQCQQVDACEIKPLDTIEKEWTCCSIYVINTVPDENPCTWIVVGEDGLGSENGTMDEAAQSDNSMEDTMESSDAMDYEDSMMVSE